MKPHIKNSKDPLKDERYTTAETIAECERLAGVERFTLDVAACDAAHWAQTYYSKEEDGLTSPWAGAVWCNPPYSDIRPWVSKAWEEFDHGERDVSSISMLLPATRTEQPWWQELVEPYRDLDGGYLKVHFLRGRPTFGNPDDPAGVDAGSSPFPVVLLVWRRP